MRKIRAALCGIDPDGLLFHVRLFLFYSLAVLVCLAVVITAWRLTVGPAWGHTAKHVQGVPLEWEYPTRCCWGPANGRTGDCGMIPSSAVKEGPDGYELNLQPGDHPYVTKPSRFVVAYDKAEVAPDGAYHVCFRKRSDGGLEVRCFFAGSRAY